MATMAKFRATEPLPTGFEAAQAELQKSPNLYGALGVLAAPLNPVDTASNVAAGFRGAGKAIFPGWDDPYGSSGNAYGFSDYAASSINQQGGFMPVSPKAQEVTGLPPSAVLSNDQIVALAPPVAMRTPEPTPSTTIFAGPDTATGPRAYNYGRGITEIVGAPGQQGRSFTNLIPSGAPETGINEMTSRFRTDTQGVQGTPEAAPVAEPTSVSTSAVTTREPMNATAAGTPVTGFRQPKSIEDYLSGVRATGGPGDLLALGIASRLSANDTAMANRQENLAARGIRQQQKDRELGTAEVNAQTALENARAYKAKTLTELNKSKDVPKVGLSEIQDPLNPLKMKYLLTEDGVPSPTAIDPADPVQAQALRAFTRARMAGGEEARVPFDEYLRYAREQQGGS